MDALRARRLPVTSRSLMLIIPILILLVLSVIWNVWQYRLVKQARQLALATEREKAQQVATEAAHIEARRKKKAEDAAALQRTQQLYREIENLSQLSDQLSDQLHAQPVQQLTPPSSDEAANGPP
jgi:hypothetical protein